MKTLMFSYLLLISIASANAQIWEWTKPEPNRVIDPSIETNGDGSEGDNVHDVEVDDLGNSYVLGDFRGEFYLDKVFITNNVGSYLAKYSSSGALLWYKLFIPDNNGTTIVGTDLVVNGAGIFVTGKYDPGYYTSYDCQTNTGMGVSRSYKIGDQVITSFPGEIDYFLVKFDFDGNVGWTKNASRAACRNNTFWGRDQISYNPLLTTDKDNNIITCFVFPSNFSSMNIGGDIIPLSGSTAQNTYHILAVKFNSEGVIQWSGYGLDYNSSYVPRVSSIIADGAGDIFLYGQANNNDQFGSITYQVLGSTSISTYVAKLNSLGQWIFAKELANISSLDLEGGIGNPDYLTVDDQNNLYAIVNGGSPPLTIMGNLASNNYNNLSNLVKLTNDGDLLWFKPIVSNEAFASSLSLVNNGIYLTGRVRSNYQTFFGFGNLIIPPSVAPSTNNVQYFVAKANLNGDFIWAHTFASDYYASHAQGLSLKANSNGIYNAGFYRYNITTLGPLGGTFTNDPSVHQIFFGKLKDQFVTVGAVRPTTICSGGTITIPFTSYGLLFSNTNTFTAQLSDANGDFSNAIDIGSVVSSGTGSIEATIPSLSSGTSGYRIRIKSSDLLNTGNSYYAYADKNYAITVGPTSYYFDADHDGFGGQEGVLACSAPAGYVTNSDDCDDNNSSINPNTAWYLDADNDGYYTGSATISCTSPGAGYKFSGLIGGDDCDDNNASIHSVMTFYLDADGDGYGDPLTTTSACSSTSPAGYVTNNTDCNDANASVNPNTTWYLDADNDGYFTGSGIASCNSPGAGYKYTGLTGGGDCNDNNVNINPGKTEICGNSIDDNCDGQVDEGCINNSLPTISINNVAVYESELIASLTVSLSSIANSDITVGYSTADGTATTGKGKKANNDYTAVSGNLILPAGSIEGHINIGITNDNINEGSETFSVNISLNKPNSKKATIENGVGTVTILNGNRPTAKLKGTREVTMPNLFSVSVRPNPTNDRFIISFSSSDKKTPVSMKVMDILGRQLEFSYSINPNSEVEIGRLFKSGIYILEVTQGNKVERVKLIKQ